MMKFKKGDIVQLSYYYFNYLNRLAYIDYVNNYYHVSYLYGREPETRDIQQFDNNCNLYTDFFREEE